jgi:hypothetical protein
MRNETEKEKVESGKGIETNYTHVIIMLRLPLLMPLRPHLQQ